MTSIVQLRAPTVTVNVGDFTPDSTGAIDSTVAFVNARNALPTVTIYANPSNNTGASATYHVGTLFVPAGTYKIGSSGDIGNLGPFVSLIGAGHACTTLAYYGSGDCLRLFNAVNPANQFDTLSAWAGKIDGLMIDGTHAGNGASGLHYGDTEGGVLGPDLFIFNFSGTGSKGIWFDNTVSWTENLWVRAVIRNCTTAVLMDYNGASFHSFEYNTMLFKIYALPNQNGVVLQNGVYFINGSLTMLGNFLRSASVQSSAALTLTGTGTEGHTLISDSHLTIQVETDDPGGGTNGPQTIKFGDISNNAIYSCTGILNFGGAFVASNWSNANNTGNFQLSGHINGDSNLSSASQHGGGFVVSGAMILGEAVAAQVSNFALFPFSQGDVFSMTLNQNVSVFPTGSALAAGAQRKTIIITQAAAGGPFTVTWPKPGSPTLSSPAIYWAGGTAPTMSAGANAIDIYYLETLDGIRWYGRAAQNMS